MINVVDELKKALSNNDLDEYLRILQSYLEKKVKGVSNSCKGMIYDWIHNLVKLYTNKKRFEEAYTIIKNLEKQLGKYTIAEKISRLYLYCFKPKDAERVYFSNGVNNKILLMRIYLLEGRVEDVKKVMDELLKDNSYQFDQKIISKYKIMIDNNLKYGSFIETEYSCFIENGNKLEGGYIVFLKSTPLVEDKDYGDLKANYRPYMIWKIEDNDVYLFPLDLNYNDSDYKL